MLAGTERKVFYLVFAILLFSSIILQSQSNLTSVINGIQFPGQEVLFQKNSLYGDIVVTKTGGQVNFFENSIPLFSSENTMQNEESVHYAMVQHENPRRVLLISGGVSGTLKEILKYNVDEVDYVELDPLLVEVGRVYAPSSGVENPKVRTISIDGRFFVKQSTGSFDVVLLAVGDPTTAQAGRYYTLEFFNDLKKLVGSDGVISVPLVSSENYVGAEKRMLNSCVFKTLRQVFKNIIVIPGDRSFLIASDKELTYDIAGKIRQRNLDTLYVNEGYLKGRLTEERINYALDSMSDESAMLNTDFKPAAYYYYLAYWTRYFHLNINYLAITVLLLFALFFARMRPLPAVVSSAGFAGASMQIILVLCFQVLYGQAYYKIGSIVACFMLGLALGAGYAYHRLKSKPLSLSLIILCLAACCFALPIAVLILSKTTSTLTQILFPLFSVAFGLMAGMLFPTAAEVYIRYRKDSAEKVMGVLYSADLFGAFFGSTVVSIFLVPIYGIISSCLLVGLLCLFSWYLISSRNEKEKT
jgi:spermidine synthase